MATSHAWLATLGLRQGERRRGALAFSALFVTMLGHSALETARDALFLEHLPPARLPLVYFAIAAVALTVGRGSVSAARRFGPQLVLPITLLIGAVVTLLFWRLVIDGGLWILSAFYVWVGVFATAAVTQLWLRISDLFDVGQAKRIYGFVGAGALLGAFAGSASSAGLLSRFGTSSLLPLGAAAFLLATGLGQALGKASHTPAPGPARPTGEATPHRERRYARRLALGVFVGSALFTVVDLVFKSAVSAQVEGPQLGAFFARTYSALNLAAVLVQLWIAPRLLRGYGVHWASMLLPVLLIFGGLGILLSGGLAAAILARGADGVLRHGLHKTSTEILYMPLSNPTRARLKAFTEVFAQRGGQAAAAGLSWVAGGLGAPTAAAGAAVVLLGLTWWWLLRGLLRDYLGLFRRHLRSGLGAAEVPQLDLGALETLIAALSADDDREVVGALEWLSAYGRPHLVPALVLLHPSKQVALRAFAFFEAFPRPEAVRVARRRFADPDPGVRAAAMHLVARHSDDESPMQAALQDPSPAVRAEGLTLLLARGSIAPEAASVALQSILEHTDKDGAVAVARALATLPPAQFSSMACHLVRNPEPEVLNELARALADNSAPEYIEPLIRLLGRRPARASARRALLVYGPAAVDALTRALNREDLPWSVRRQVADALADFGGPEVAEALLSALTPSQEDRTARTVIRALSRLRTREPHLMLDRERLLALISHWLRRAVTFLHAHVAVRCVLKLRPQTRTATAELLISLLEEKEDFAKEQVFLLLQALSPRADFAAMHAALSRSDRRVRASTRELLTHFVPPDLRVGIDALTDELSHADRLEAAVRFYEPPTRAQLKALEPLLSGAPPPEDGQDAALSAYGTLLSALAQEPSEVLRALVDFHAQELKPKPTQGLAQNSAFTALGQATEDLSDAWR